MAWVVCVYLDPTGRDKALDAREGPKRVGRTGADSRVVGMRRHPGGDLRLHLHLNSCTWGTVDEEAVEVAG